MDQSILQGKKSAISKKLIVLYFVHRDVETRANMQSTEQSGKGKKAKRTQNNVRERQPSNF